MPARFVALDAPYGAAVLAGCGSSKSPSRGEHGDITSGDLCIITHEF